MLNALDLGYHAFRQKFSTLVSNARESEISWFAILIIVPFTYKKIANNNAFKMTLLIPLK
jgi:hypothetical protein